MSLLVAYTSYQSFYDSFFLILYTLNYFANLTHSLPLFWKVTGYPTTVGATVASLMFTTLIKISHKIPTRFWENLQGLTRYWK